MGQCWGELIESDGRLSVHNVSPYIKYLPQSPLTADQNEKDSLVSSLSHAFSKMAEDDNLSTDSI